VVLEDKKPEECVQEGLRRMSNPRVRAAIYALGYVGIPYKWGGDTPEGFDCTGLISFCYRLVGVDLYHHTAYDLLNYCEVSLGPPQVGDLVFRRRRLGAGDEVIDHVGIVVKLGMVVSARRNDCVRMEVLTEEFNIVTRLRLPYTSLEIGEVDYLNKQPRYSIVKEILD